MKDITLWEEKVKNLSTRINLLEKKRKEILSVALKTEYFKVLKQLKDNDIPIPANDSSIHHVNNPRHRDTITITNKIRPFIPFRDEINTKELVNNVMTLYPNLKRNTVTSLIRRELKASGYIKQSNMRWKKITE